MLLTDDQRDELAYRINDHLGDNNLFGTAARDLFGAEVVREVRGGSTPFQNARAYVRHMLDQPTSAVFINVVREVDVAGTLLEIRQIVTRLESGELTWAPRGGGDGNVVWMPVDQPFADRTELRSVVRNIAHGTGPGAIAIEAPVGHGKRTMCMYIEDYARRLSVTPVVEHLRRTGNQRMVDFLTERLRLEIPSRVAVPSLDPRRQARLLARDAAQGATPVWFVVNLQEPEQDDGVLGFVDELLGQVQSDQRIAQGLRLTVLANDLRAVELANLPDGRHRYTLPEIRCREIEEWLELATPGLAKHRYELAASTVLDVVDEWDPTPDMRLKYVAQQCVAAHRVLRGALNGQG